jgi:hypothetical protein
MSNINFEIVNKTTCLCARRCSGKSVLLKYIIQKNKHLFDAKFLICPTEKINKFYGDVFKPENVYETYSDNWVFALMDKMAKINEGKNDKDSKHVLLVLDDVCSDTDFHHSKTFKQLFTKGRHYKISLIITAQYPYHISPIARVNCDWFLCGQINTQGLEIICTEFIAGDIDKNSFIKMYYRATSNYGFLVINNNSTKSNNDLNSIYGVIRCPKQYIK